MTKIEIILETVEFYSADPTRRSMGIMNGLFNEICMYKAPNGNECAFQRVVETDLSSREGQSCVGIIHMKQENPEDFELVFKEPYRGYENDTLFWKSIQNIHDRSENWDENGLSEKGKEYVDELLVKYKGQ